MTSHPQVSPSAESALGGSQIVKEFFHQLNLLASSAGSKYVSSLLEENSNLQGKLEQAQVELTKFKGDMGELEKKKQTTTEELLAMNRKEVTKQDELRKQIESLKTSLEDQKEQVTEKQSAFNDLKAQFDKTQESYLREKEKVVRAHSDITTLQQNIKEKDTTIDKMKSVGSELKQQFLTVKKTAKDLSDENKGLKQRLQAAEEQIRKFENLPAKYHEEDEEVMLERFKKLWEYAIKETYCHLQKDLPAEAFENLQAWKKFQEKSDQALRHHIPLPLSNSKEAKQMRLAVILGILSREIDKYIFQPTYILPDDSQIREMLANLAISENEKESFCRLLLLSIDWPAQKRECEARIQIVVRNVASYLYGLLTETQFDEFCLGVQKIVSQSAEIWEKFQRTKQKYETDFEPIQWGDLEWEEFPFPEADGSENRRAEGTPDENLLTVFPRISTVDNDGRAPLTFAIQVRRSSPVCIAAGQELAPQISGPLPRRTASSRPRRKTVTENTSNGPFLGGKAQ
ncbi:hypothetical protein Asppvi_000187 [Aspergillus pseudoviridinutans]|uniref:Mei5 protein n=1 Tax=Aspergillus pseudoviridinutans TaxID=1517512 RepID=A0A9P3B0T5_9EURO|nr:uncharacterized protein Asppvi_000187 [Aspergillus pseudoviridinutans]GIJ81687.1 hypothetical protein Asppvi_000187 [Aspergillus pseudoviridinutans]